MRIPSRRAATRAPFFVLVLVLLATAAFALGACDTGAETGPAERQVVVYTSVDQHFAEPVLDAYAEEEGVEVLPVFDVEAAKTTGLVNRLLEEKDRPQADVWWNGEFAQTLSLADEGLFTPYSSPNAEGIPGTYVDPDGMWTGFGGRARVIIINTDMVVEEIYPSSIYDLLDSPIEPERIGLAYPIFGTTATHAAALYALMGPPEALDYYQAVRDRGVRIVDGNSVVRDMVANGQLAFGLTDTDDACAAVERDAPVTLVFPDQGSDGMGTLVVPNTVALVAGGPNPDEGRKLIDHLLSPETEAELIEAGWFHVALRDSVEVDPGCVDATGVKGLDVSLVEIAEHIEQAKAELAEVFVR